MPEWAGQFAQRTSQLLNRRPRCRLVFSLGLVVDLFPFRQERFDVKTKLLPK
jgi:hypothetical protein